MVDKKFVPLTWCDLNKEQLDAITNAPNKERAYGLLAQFMGLSDTGGDSRQGIVMDFYSQVIKFCLKLQLSAEKASTFFSIAKLVHAKSIEERLTLNRSFDYMKTLLLQHSVHRPPYSVGIFTLQESKQMTDYMINTYFKHHKLYQYSYQKRVTMSITSSSPGDNIELPPVLQPLTTAIPEVEWNARLEEEALFKKEEEERLEKERIEKDEEARQARLKSEFDAAIPDEVKSQVDAVLKVELKTLQEKMETQFKTQEEALVAKIAQLETKIGPAS